MDDKTLLHIYHDALMALANVDDNESAVRMRALARLILERNPCPTA